MRTLLLTTDGSDRSMTVVPHARRLAEALKLDVAVVRVIDPPAPKRGPATDIEAESRAEVVAALDDAGLDWPVTVLALPRGTNTQSMLRDHAKATGASAIALHSRGSNTLRHAIAGSVAMGLVGLTDLPVFVTGGHTAPPANADGYHVLIAVDGSPASLRSVQRIGDFFAGSDAAVTLLRVHVPAIGDRGRAELEECQHQVNGLLPVLPSGLRAKALAVTANELERVETTIGRVAKELGADVIAMSTHGHSALRHVVLGSTAAGVIGHAAIPALLVRTID